MAGYYDETTGAWVDTGSTGVTQAPLDNTTSGTGTVGNYTTTQTLSDGSTLIFDNSGNVIGSTPAPDAANTTGSAIENSAGAAPSSSTGIASVSDLLKKLFTKTDSSGNTTLNTGMLGAVVGGLGGALGLGQINRAPTGYQGGIPRYVATRQAPGPGQRISGNVTYAPAPTTQAAGGGTLHSGGFVIPADVVSHFGNGSSDAGLKFLANRLGASPIKGKGDGMSDSIHTSIDGHEKALVAHEEAYLTPQQVAHIGGGNASKGAEKLRSMMAHIRQARTGTTEQGRQVNPNKFMPGGEVKRYATGDTTASAGAINAGLSGTESNLSNWAGPYVTDMLAKGQALSEMPYEQYSGPLTAGESPLQTQAFGTASNLQTPASIGQAAGTAGGIATAAQNLNYTPTTGTFDTAAAQQYMNPYLQQALAPQLAELQRQNQIANMTNAGKLTQAGAYGGSRQAVMDAENQRNMMQQIAATTGQGYNTAYNNAMSQFNADQQRKMQEAQFGANYGLQGLQTGLQAAQAQGALGSQENQANLANLNEQATLGATQRGIQAEDITAQQNAFNEARANPYKMVQFQQSLLSGLPLAAQSYNISQPSTLQQILSGIGGGASLTGATSTDLQTALKNLGINFGTTTTAATPTTTTATS
jgi:hypothetical protein